MVFDIRQMSSSRRRNVGALARIGRVRRSMFRQAEIGRKKAVPHGDAIFYDER